MCLEVCATQFISHAIGHFTAVTSQHGNPFYAAFPEFCNGLTGFWSGLVLKTDPAQTLIVFGHIQGAEALLFVHIGVSHLV